VGLLVVVPAFCGAALGAGLLALGSVVKVGSSTGHGLQIGPPRLKPIPIPPRACPYLKTVRVTSGAAAAVWLGSDPSSPNLDWTSRTFHRRLEAALPPLELALRVAATQVPAPVRVQLSDSANQVALGRSILPTARDGVFDDQLLNAMLAGTGSLANATELVGNACGFTLAPDALVF
jgi:hypothetical protein